MSQVRNLYNPPSVQVVERHTHKSKELGAAGSNPALDTKRLAASRTAIYALVAKWQTRHIQDVYFVGSTPAESTKRLAVR